MKLSETWKTREQRNREGQANRQKSLQRRSNVAAGMKSGRFKPRPPGQRKKVEHLDRLRELHSVLSESELLESLKGTYADYMGGASSNFLKAAIPGIKKIAGGHAESVNVRRGVGSDYAVLEYVGQDRSDNDLKVSISVFPGSDFNANIFFQVSTIRGHHQEDISMKSGVLTPDVIVRKFQSVFGL